MLELLSGEAGGQYRWGLRVRQRIQSGDSRPGAGVKPGLPADHRKNVQFHPKSTEGH